MEKGETITYETFLANKKKKGYARYRQICKALNLGFPGGIGYEVMGGQLFKQGVDIPKVTLKGEEGKPLIAFTEKQATYYMQLGRQKNPNLRMKRIGKCAWIFIVDELVGLKARYFDMYPEDAGKLAYFPEGAKEAFDMEKYKSKTRDHGWNEGVDDKTA